MFHFEFGAGNLFQSSQAKEERVAASRRQSGHGNYGIDIIVTFLSASSVIRTLPFEYYFNFSFFTFSNKVISFSRQSISPKTLEIQLEVKECQIFYRKKRGIDIKRYSQARYAVLLHIRPILIKLLNPFALSLYKCDWI